MPSRPICGSGIVNGGHCCCSAFIFQNIFKTVFGFHFGPQLAPDAIVKHAMVGRYSTVLVQIDGSTLAHSVDTSAGGTKAFCLPSNRFQPAQILQRKKWNEVTLINEYHSRTDWRKANDYTRISYQYQSKPRLRNRLCCGCPLRCTSQIRKWCWWVS